MFDFLKANEFTIHSELSESRARTRLNARMTKPHLLDIFAAHMFLGTLQRNFFRATPNPPSWVRFLWWPVRFLSPKAYGSISGVGEGSAISVRVEPNDIGRIIFFVWTGLWALNFILSVYFFGAAYFSEPSTRSKNVISLWDLVESLVMIGAGLGFAAFTYRVGAHMAKLHLEKTFAPCRIRDPSEATGFEVGYPHEILARWMSPPEKK